MNLSTAIDNLMPVFSIVKEGRELTRDTIAELLNVVADAEVKAAHRAILDSAQSTNPIREAEMAIQFLRLAYERYYSAASRESIMQYIADMFVLTYTIYLAKPARYKSSIKAIQVALSIAFLYRQQGDIALSDQFLQRADECFKLFKEHHRSYFGPTRKYKRHSFNYSSDYIRFEKQMRQEEAKLWEAKQLVREGKKPN